MVGAVGQFHFTPDRYLELMHEEVPRYEELQEEAARATEGAPAGTIVTASTHSTSDPRNAAVTEGPA